MFEIWFVSVIPNFEPAVVGGAEVRCVARSCYIYRTVFKALPEITRSTLCRLALVFSLLLAQTAGLLHAQDHAPDPGANVCDSCLSNHNHDAALVPGTHFQPDQAADGSEYRGLDRVCVERVSILYYLTRAPPTICF